MKGSNLRLQSYWGRIWQRQILLLCSIVSPYLLLRPVRISWLPLLLSFPLSSAPRSLAQVNNIRTKRTYKFPNTRSSSFRMLPDACTVNP